MPHKLQTMSCPPRGHHHLSDLSAVLPAPRNPSSCISAIPGRATKSSVRCWRVKVVLQAVALNIMHARSSIIARHPDVTLRALVRVASVVHDEWGSVQSNQSPLAAKTPVPPHPLHTERKYDAQRPSRTRAWQELSLLRRWSQRLNAGGSQPWAQKTRRIRRRWRTGPSPMRALDSVPFSRAYSDVRRVCALLERRLAARLLCLLAS